MTVAPVERDEFAMHLVALRSSDSSGVKDAVAHAPARLRRPRGEMKPDPTFSRIRIEIRATDGAERKFLPQEFSARPSALLRAPTAASDAFIDLVEHRPAIGVDQPTLNVLSRLLDDGLGCTRLAVRRFVAFVRQPRCQTSLRLGCGAARFARRRVRHFGLGRSIRRRGRSRRLRCGSLVHRRCVSCISWGRHEQASAVPTPAWQPSGRTPRSAR